MNDNEVDMWRSEEKREEIKKQFASVINCNSLESVLGNTPDFMLAEFIMASLENYALIKSSAEAWHGDSGSIANSTKMLGEGQPLVWGGNPYGL